VDKNQAMLRRHFGALFLAMLNSRLRAQSGRPRLLLNPGELWGSAGRKADSIIAKAPPSYPEQVG